MSLDRQREYYNFKQLHKAWEEKADLLFMHFEQGWKSLDRERCIASSITQREKQEEDVWKEAANALDGKVIIKENIEYYNRMEAELNRFGLTRMKTEWYYCPGR
jgi:hypothetical protein